MTETKGAVVWINGPFGIGKTTLASCLAARLEGATLCNPEDVGGLLRQSLGEINDYRVWPEWRALVVALIDQLARSRPWVIVPMCVSDAAQWREIRDQLAERGIALTAIHLRADSAVIVDRIRGSGADEATQRFRLHHLEATAAALESSDFGTTVDTAERDPAELCQRVLTMLHPNA